MAFPGAHPAESQALSERGLAPDDLAGLRPEEISRVTGQPCSPGLVALRGTAVEALRAKKAAPFEGGIRHLFPGAQPTTSERGAQKVASPAASWN